MAARLVRDASALGLGSFAVDDVLARLLDAARASFGATGAGVVRLEARAGGELVASTRPLGPERAVWRAIWAEAVHPGPGEAPGAKRALVPALAAAREAAEAAGADEALLCDAAGRVVEGARTNLAFALADGRLAMPPLARGAVRGVALEAALDAGIALAELDVTRDALASAREIVATNAVRGARPILWLADHAVGDGRPGPLATALAAALQRG